MLGILIAKLQGVQAPDYTLHYLLSKFNYKINIVIYPELGGVVMMFLIHVSMSSHMCNSMEEGVKRILPQFLYITTIMGWVKAGLGA